MNGTCLCGAEQPVIYAGNVRRNRRGENFCRVSRAIIASLPPPNFVTVVKGTFRQDFTRTKHESFTRRNFDAAAI